MRTSDSNEITWPDSRAFCPVSAVPAASNHDFPMTHTRLTHAVGRHATPESYEQKMGQHPAPSI
jgi:hypothetical protein